jgi:hypothetical protein
MPGDARARGANRGSRRVQSAPGEPLGWPPGARASPIPVAGRKSALENLRSDISATYQPPAISALIAAVGTMGMVHPVLLTQMLVVACGAHSAVQLRKHACHVLPAGISKRNPTTSASEFRKYPLFPWSDRGSLRGAAPVVSVLEPEGASPPGAGARGKTGELSGHGGSRTTANGQLCAIPSPGKILSILYPPYISESHSYHPSFS